MFLIRLNILSASEYLRVRDATDITNSPERTPNNGQYAGDQ